MKREREQGREGGFYLCLSLIDKYKYFILESAWLVNEHFSQLIPKLFQRFIFEGPKSLTDVTTEYPAASFFKINPKRTVFASHCNENHKI